MYCTQNDALWKKWKIDIEDYVNVLYLYILYEGAPKDGFYRKLNCTWLKREHHSDDDNYLTFEGSYKGKVITLFPLKVLLTLFIS